MPQIGSLALRSFIQTKEAPEVNSDDSKFEVWLWPYFVVLLLVMWPLTLWVAMKKFFCHLFCLELKVNTYWVDGVSQASREIKENAGNWRSLDIIYNFYHGRGTWVDNFWIGIRNAQAVRNRKRVVKSFLIKHFSELAMRCEKNLTILSVASGSAQAVIEAIGILRKRGVEVTAYLYDRDETALENARTLAKKHGVEDAIRCVCEDVCNIRKVLRKLPKCHVVEMVGLLDYFKSDSATKMIKIFKQLLREEGVFLVATINHNLECFFLRTVVNWKMVYRSRREFSKVLRNSGFSKFDFLEEPLGIHHIAVAR